MDYRQNIEQALDEINIAEALVDQAKQRYYSARRKLESIYSPASPKREKSVLSQEEIAKLLFKKPKDQCMPFKRKVQ